MELSLYEYAGEEYLREVRGTGMYLRACIWGGCRGIRSFGSELFLIILNLCYLTVQEMPSINA